MESITSRLSNAAQESIRTRLRSRSRVRLIQDRAKDLEPDHGLALSLASLIGVHVDHLRHGDRLGDILRAHREDLPPEVQPLMRQVGLKDVIDPFAFELLDLVEKRLGKDRARLNHPAFDPIPSNEAEWVERIRGMTVGEFLSALD